MFTWIRYINFSNNISTSAFYIKIMRFLRVQIHSWNANVSWTLQFTSSGRGIAWYSGCSYQLLLLLSVAQYQTETKNQKSEAKNWPIAIVNFYLLTSDLWLIDYCRSYITVTLRRELKPMSQSECCFSFTYSKGHFTQLA